MVGGQTTRETQSLESKLLFDSSEIEAIIQSFSCGRQITLKISICLGRGRNIPNCFREIGFTDTEDCGNSRATGPSGRIFYWGGGGEGFTCSKI